MQVHTATSWQRSPCSLQHGPACLLAAAAAAGDAPHSCGTPARTARDADVSRCTSVQDPAPLPLEQALCSDLWCCAAAHWAICHSIMLPACITAARLSVFTEARWVCLCRFPAAMHAFLRSACSCIVQAVRMGFSSSLLRVAAVPAALWDEEALVLECILPPVSVCRLLCIWCCGFLTDPPLNEHLASAGLGVNVAMHKPYSINRPLHHRNIALQFWATAVFQFPCVSFHVPTSCSSTGELH